MSIIESAPAKINLNLLVTGKLDNGYHTLSSFVTFADFGDEVQIEPAEEFSFHITGPFARDLSSGEDNLCVRAYSLLRQPKPLKITLVKNMPVASGIGGGSADAAAVLRGLKRLGASVDEDKILSLGADVPVCYLGKPCLMSGVGEKMTLHDLPQLYLLLVNPGFPVPTLKVFRARTGPFSRDLEVFPERLEALKNDLEETACRLYPEITTVLNKIKSTSHCQLSRLSGSGATCFGVYPDLSSAKVAEKEINKEHPLWWTQVTTTIAS